MRECRKVEFEFLAVLHLFPVFDIEAIALLKAGLGFGVGRVLELEGEQVIFHLLPPAFVEFLFGLGPGELFGVDHHAFVDGKIVLCVDQFAGRRIAIP